MAEYIEREAAIEICSNQYKECLRKNDWCGDTIAWNIGFGIKAIPAADVAPVVHGRWEVRGQEVFCTNCDNESGHNAFGASVFSNYCPNCGAKMDLEGNDGTAQKD